MTRPKPSESSRWLAATVVVPILSCAVMFAGGHGAGFLGLVLFLASVQVATSPFSIPALLGLLGLVSLYLGRRQAGTRAKNLMRAALGAGILSATGFGAVSVFYGYVGKLPVDRDLLIAGAVVGAFFLPGGLALFVESAWLRQVLAALASILGTGLVVLVICKSEDRFISVVTSIPALIAAVVVFGMLIGSMCRRLPKAEHART